MQTPLAVKMRPRKLIDILGQSHLTDEHTEFHTIVGLDKPRSLILSGPPGCGKTSMARIVAAGWSKNYEYVSCLKLDSKKIRDLTSGALEASKIVILDEIHVLKKAQQDLLLDAVEDRKLVIIGLTSENPSFAINRALISRVRTFTLRPLIEDDIKAMILRALKDKENGYGLSGLSISKSALAHLLNASGCDPRCALDNLELVMDAISDSALEIGMPEVVIISTTTEQVSDKYDFLSAFHKSIRGSDTNAALLWLGALLHQVDCDVKEITRRLLAICSEDVGIKDHYATSIVLSHIDAYERLGPAEGERALAQAVIYLCAAPKSNIVYKSWGNVKAIIEKNNLVVPNHLKNASTKQARDLGYGVGYEKPLDGSNADRINYAPEGWPADFSVIRGV